MPVDASNTPSRTALLKHLDRVYEMARVLAPTDKQSSKLVEATYRRAAQSAPPEAHRVRAWLLRLLLQTYATRRSDAATTSSVSTMRRSADLLQDFRFQAAEDALQKVVPVAFALQPPREQLVLTLCDIVEVNTDEAAVILDTDPEALMEERAAAHTSLWETTRTELTDGERTLVEEELPDDALLDALRCVIAPHLGPLPPTLRPSVTAIMEQTPSDEAEEDLALPDEDLFEPSAEARPTETQHTAPGTDTALSDRLQRFGGALLLILITGLAGYLVASVLLSGPASTATDLLQLSVQQADAVRPGLETGNIAEAEQFVREQLGRRIAVPTIEAAALSGVSIVEIDAGARVPAFVFDDDASDQRITTYVYTYALLDQLGERVQLAQDMRQQLQEEERINLQEFGERGVLVWRKHDDIYVAVTKTDPRQMRPRISHPS